MARGVFHWDPYKKCIVDGPAPTRTGLAAEVRVQREDGVVFQVPENYDDGSGKFRHLPSGPFKGRVYFQSRAEARELAKRIQDHQGINCRADR